MFCLKYSLILLFTLVINFFHPTFAGSVIDDDQVYMLADIREMAGEEDNRISYGLEVEYNIQGLEKNKKGIELFRYYHRSDISPEDWIKLTPDEKSAIAHENGVGRPKSSLKMKKLEERYVEFTHPDQYFLYEHLNDELDRESGGAYEINGMVFTDFLELKRYVNVVDENFGEGNYEGHVVSDFTSLKGLAGFSLFFHDMHMLKREGQNYEMYLESKQDPLYRPGELYQSYSLRPVEAPTLEGAYNLEKITTTDFKKAGFDSVEDYCAYNRSARVRRSSGICYRLSNYPLGKVGVEIRTHELGYRTKRPDPDASQELIKSMDQTSAILAKDGDYRKFQFMDKTFGPTEISIIDEKSMVVPDNLKLLEAKNIKAYLERMLASKQLSRKNKKKIKKMLPQVHSLPFDCKRFLYPLRAWFDHPIFRTIDKKEHKKVRNRIVATTLEFLKESLAAAKEFEYVRPYNMTNLPKKDEMSALEYYESVKYRSKAYSLACQTAMGIPAGKWARDVKLASYFEDYINKASGNID